MPPKSKKAEMKKTETGLQRMDRFFKKSNDQPTTAKCSSSVQEYSKKSVVVISDSDDELPHLNQQPNAVITKSSMTSIDSPNGSLAASSKYFAPSTMASIRRKLELNGSAPISKNDKRARIDAESPKSSVPQIKRSETVDVQSQRTSFVSNGRERVPLVQSQRTSFVSNERERVPLVQSQIMVKETCRKFSPPSGQSKSCPATPVKPSRTPSVSPTKSVRKLSPHNGKLKFRQQKSRSLPNIPMKFNVTFDPYYLANFKFIVYSVIYDKFFQDLFNDQDRELVDVFKALSREAKMVYIRLFQRKVRWLQSSSIKYPTIAEDLSPFLEELVTANFFENQTHLLDLKCSLSLLAAPELRDLAKKFHIKTANAQKEDLLVTLMKHSNRTTISTMMGAKSDLAISILNEARRRVGNCYRILSEPKALFTRCLMLFSLTSTVYEDDESPGQEQLYKLLQINRGEFKYPDYTVCRSTQIYWSRDSLVEFQESLYMDGEMHSLLSKNNHEKGLELFEKARTKYEAYLTNVCKVSYDFSLPRFLQKYTAACVYVRLLNHGVVLLQKLRRYQEANEVLETLLSQDHCADHRGSWYDRLALNLESHLKAHAQALDVIARGMADPLVKVGRRLALYQRAERICKSPSQRALRHRLKEFSHPSVAEIPTVTIQGQLIPKSLPGVKTSFICRSTDPAGNPDRGDVFLCSVEEVALAHYRELGYNRGVHGEGSTLMTLLMLFMWDIVFDSDVQDVFYNDYQTAPLDLWTDEFYKNRKSSVDEFLTWMRGGTNQELIDALKKSWLSHKDVVCDGLNWNIFSSLEDAQSLVLCLGGEFLSRTFRRHVEDMRHCRSGVPDLMVWNTYRHTFKIVEVKGPGDRLSTKQILWLDYYLSLGAQAEVCHVKGIGAKKLRKIDHATSSQTSASTNSQDSMIVA